MRLYIIRHGDPDYVNNTLTPRGHLEAKALARRLAAQGLDRIYSSPEGRALHTAQYAAELLQLQPELEDWTREIQGLWVNESPWGPMSAWDIPGEAVRVAEGDAVPSELAANRMYPLLHVPVQGKLEELAAHSDRFLSRHGFVREGAKYRITGSQPNREKIAVFCHAGFGLAWLSHLLGIPAAYAWVSFFLAPSSVTTILFEERSPEWAVPRCIGLCDITHIHESGLEVNPFGTLGNFY